MFGALKVNAASGSSSPLIRPSNTVSASFVPMIANLGSCRCVTKRPSASVTIIQYRSYGNPSRAEKSQFHTFVNNNFMNFAPVVSTFALETWQPRHPLTGYTHSERTCMGGRGPAASPTDCMTASKTPMASGACYSPPAATAMSGYGLNVRNDVNWFGQVN